MIKSTLCYIENDGKYLMLYRNKKENDLNLGKWVGIGGKVEPGESIDMCLRREVFEETGVELVDYLFAGIIEFRSDTSEDEDMYLYLARKYLGEVNMDCREGTLEWIPKDRILDLNL